MNQFSDKEKNIIDKYYREDHSKIMDLDLDLDLNIELDSEFEKKLNESMKSMDVFCDADIKVPNDFFEIIEKAEEIKTKKAANIEFVIFIATSMCILLAIAAATLEFGIEAYIIVEAILFVILPISLLPISKAVLKRGEIK